MTLANGGGILRDPSVLQDFSRGYGVVNVKDFGATGNGVTDDTQAIQNAINLLGSLGGGTLVIPPGTYSVNSIQLVSNLRIVGSPNSILQQQQAATQGIFTYNMNNTASSPIQNVMIDGLTFIGNTSSNAQPYYYQSAVYLNYCQNIAVKNCTIKNFVDAGVRFTYATNIWVDKNYFYNIGANYGGGNLSQNTIDISNNTNNYTSQSSTFGQYWVRDNILDSGSSGGIVIQAYSGNPNKVVISGNIVKNYANWSGIELEAGYATRGIISNNQVYECVNGIAVVFSGTPLPSGEQLSDIVISGNYVEALNTSYAYGISSQANRTTISGNAVRVTGPGVYLQGFSTSNPILSVAISGNVITNVNTDTSKRPMGIYMQYVSNCNITGNQITAISGASTSDAIYFSVCDHINIVGNELRLFGRNGISCGGSAGTSSYINIASNSIYDMNASQYDNNAGIHCINANSVNIKSNVIMDTRQTAQMQFGIWLESSCSDLEIINNRISPTTSLSFYNAGATNVRPAITSDMQLTTTSATTVASITPTVQGNFEIKVYYRVVNAATNLTITVTYTDGSGLLQTYNIVNGGSQAVGPYSCVPVLINATSASPITVTATAGTSNNVYVSCTIKPE
jgi:hypothetical protein